MWHTAKRLSLGVTLIVAAAAILLLSDPPRRTSTTTSDDGRSFRVAVLQMASQPIMEDGAAGVIDALREQGYAEDRNLSIKRFNAEGDTATVNAMAQEADRRRLRLGRHAEHALACRPSPTPTSSDRCRTSSAW